MRRLPIFLVLDVSESMAGAPLDELEKGVQMLSKTLTNDPMALETAYLSIIAFAGKAKVLTPLTSILDFIPPTLSIGAGTNLSSALECLMKEIDTKVKKNTPTAKGDWKPLIFILTDGTPNDNYLPAVNRWKAQYGKYTVLAVLMGEHSDATALKTLTDNVIVFKEATPESFSSFFRWVSSSVQTSSKELGVQEKTSIEDTKQLRVNFDADLLAETIPTKNKIEYFVLPVRCQSTKKPYIMRYVKKAGSRLYVLDGAYPVDEGYFELSGVEESNKRISEEMLDGKVAPCPYCENTMLGQSGCGKWLCLNPSNLNRVKCPWCNQIETFGGGVGSLNGGLG